MHVITLHSSVSSSLSALRIAQTFLPARIFTCHRDHLQYVTVRWWNFTRHLFDTTVAVHFLHLDDGFVWVLF